MSAKRAIVFWFAGLSGSGKTTITQALVEKLSAQGKTVKIFDGDVVRQELNTHLGFTPADIRENNRIIAELCAKNRALYDYIFVPIISPFEDARVAAREKLAPDFYVVYIKASLEEVMKRDVKGLYKKAVAGEIHHFIGLDPQVPFQVPKSPDLILDTQEENSELSVSKFLEFIDSCTS